MLGLRDRQGLDRPHVEDVAAPVLSYATAVTLLFP